MKIKCKNGNEIVFSGLDDTEKLKSITFENGELTDVWVEEAAKRGLPRPSHRPHPRQDEA